MEIRENEKICIIAPICSKIDAYKTTKLLEEIEGEHRRIALDLAYVSDCSIDFLEALKSLKKKIGLFNIPSDIFVLFNVMNLDKTVQLFVSEIDFEEESRQLINRKFALV